MHRLFIHKSSLIIKVKNLKIFLIEIQKSYNNNNIEKYIVYFEDLFILRCTNIYVHEKHGTKKPTIIDMHDKDIMMSV